MPAARSSGTRPRSRVTKGDVGLADELVVIDVVGPSVHEPDGFVRGEEGQHPVGDDDRRPVGGDRVRVRREEVPDMPIDLVRALCDGDGEIGVSGGPVDPTDRLGHRHCHGVSGPAAPGEQQGPLNRGQVLEALACSRRVVVPGSTGMATHSLLTRPAGRASPLVLTTGAATRRPW